MYKSSFLGIAALALSSTASPIARGMDSHILASRADGLNVNLMYFETAAQNSKWYTYTSSANGWDSCWIASYIDALPNTDPAFNKVGSSSSGVFTFHWGNEMGKDTALNAASGTALGTLTKDGDGAVLNCQRTVTNDMGTLPATTGACQILANVPGDGATPPAAITQGMLVAKCS